MMFQGGNLETIYRKPLGPMGNGKKGLIVACDEVRSSGWMAVASWCGKWYRNLWVYKLINYPFQKGFQELK
jgi:hypothetical protein